ncbi:MAG: hypothetical protein R2838_09855 [Caldilineaceae bacterium]
MTLGISIVAGQLVALIKGVEPAWGLAGFFRLHRARSCAGPPLLQELWRLDLSPESSPDHLHNFLASARYNRP